MSSRRSKTRSTLRVFAGLLGVALLAYLILRAGPASICREATKVGWGLGLIILLGGISHLIKTWAWRLTFASEIRDVSLARTFALRLASEAAAQFGLPGQVLGDTMRVSLLGSAVPVADSISSVTLDRGLYAVSSAIVSFTGILCLLALVSFSAAWRTYALVFAGALALFLAVTAIAIQRGWPVFSGPARAVGRVPWFRHWLQDKHAVIDSAERIFLGCYHERPIAFWLSLSLNLAAQGIAILEIYLLANFMGARMSLLGAFALEALTKVINLIGLFNPGNIGTYEGGNMIAARLFGITNAAGLTLALCRRTRALFWAAIGALCLILLPKLTQRRETGSKNGSEPAIAPETHLAPSANLSELNPSPSPAAIIWVESGPHGSGFTPALARVGTLPVLLRAILTVKALPVGRIIVSLDSSEALIIKHRLYRTGRLPENIEWRERAPGSDLPSLLRDAAATADHVMLLLGNRTYQPALLQSVRDWKETTGALALETGAESAGLYALSHVAALDVASECLAGIETLDDFDNHLRSSCSVATISAPSDSWQDIASPQDLLAAERKLDNWLVKPTDGLFARMNRTVSIPISRQLIKFPITANMVTLFTLGVSVASGILFSLGGYWYMALGALVSVFASILDGCDGEVARLKLQSTALGCWLDSICDYLYYLIVFGGIAIGLKKSLDSNAYLAWGIALLVGAVLSFVTVSIMRRRKSGDRPEKYLAVWQQKAEQRKSNPLLFLSRYTEFVVRRCFFPYGLLAFALLGLLHVVFVISAIAANVVWMMTLYSWFTFSRPRESSVSCGKTRICSNDTVKVSL